jgi:hypothetical protein
MRRINIRTGALGSVGVLVLVGCPAASATSGSSAAAHSNAILAFVVKPQRSTADAGRAVHTPTSPPEMRGLSPSSATARAKHDLRVWPCGAQEATSRRATTRRI